MTTGGHHSINFKRFSPPGKKGVRVMSESVIIIRFFAFTLTEALGTHKRIYWNFGTTVPHSDREKPATVDPLPAVLPYVREVTDKICYILKLLLKHVSSRSRRREFVKLVFISIVIVKSVL